MLKSASGPAPSTPSLGLERESQLPQEKRQKMEEAPVERASYASDSTHAESAIQLSYTAESASDVSVPKRRHGGCGGARKHEKTHKGRVVALADSYFVDMAQLP